MRLLSRSIFREIFTSALLGTVLFTFVLFLRSLRSIFEQLLQSSAPASTTAYLAALLLPPAIVFALPIGVLVGTLIGLSRMSSDNEITAMRAAGVSSRTVATPVLFFAFLAMLVTAACSIELTPFSIRETYRILNKLIAEELTAQIQPGVFEESFPNTILYVGEVAPGSVTKWRPVFMADLTEPKDRKSSASEHGDAPRILVASEALVTPDVQNNRIQLNMVNVAEHEVGSSGTQYYHSTYPAGVQLLEAKKKDEKAPSRPYEQYDIGPLYKAQKKDLDARIEFHRRLALPVACLILGLVAIPLGVSSRRGGKSGAFVITVVLALAYYTALISLIGLARQHTLPAGIAVWLPNLVYAVLGAIFLARLELPGDRDLIGSARHAIARIFAKLHLSINQTPKESGTSFWERLPLLGSIMDAYVLRSFLFYFFVTLLGFVVMVEVFTFFELLSDIVKNHIAMTRVGMYLFYLGPKLIYDTAPLGVLVAVLVAFGIMTKQNEITAFKACGISLHRLSIPVVLMASILSVSLFAFDYYILPDANRKQDALRAEIKNKPIQTYLRPDRRWIFGEKGSRIYYYKYFDTNEEMMVNVSVYDLDPHTFLLKRHISAQRAHWAPNLNTWIFEGGWVREFSDKRDSYSSFESSTRTFPGLDEPPSYFMKEVKQYTQMNIDELRRYIDELHHSGFDTVRLQVQLYRKFSVPLFALIMAMISVPFAFLTGNRGAMAGVGVSFGIAIAYFAVNSLFEQIGNLNQLPASMAAWSPDAVFALAALYLLVRMRT